MKKKILSLDKNYIWHPFTQSKNSDDPIIIEKGTNEKLIDIDGNQYIDLISSWWVNIHGHGREEISEAINLQSKKLEQVVFAGFTHEPAVNLAFELVKLLPKDFKRVFYSDNGSTSVEIALKVAYQFWYQRNKKKRKFVAFNGGYHGDTVGAMSVGFSSGFYTPFNDLIFKSFFIPFPDNWKGHNSINEQEEKSLKAIDTLLSKEASQLAAVIIEPLIQGASGMKMCRPEYLDEVVRKFQSKDVLVIFDEVMTGFGRTGKMFACDYLTNSPDIVCLAKSLTGGFLPLAATVFKEFIHEEFVDESIKKAFLHGHSFSANPIACMAALESIKIFKNNSTLNKVLEIEKIHKEELDNLKANPLIAKTRHLGDVAAFDIVGFDKNYGSKIGEILKKTFLQKGLLLRPLGSTFYLMPPYCIKEEHLRNSYQIINSEIKKLYKFKND